MSAKVTERHRKLADDIYWARFKGSLAQLLADTMQQARLEEAEWWNAYVGADEREVYGQHLEQRIAALKAEVKPASS